MVNHGRGMAIPNFDVKEVDGWWVVTSQSNHHVYIVKREVEGCSYPDHCMTLRFEVACIGLCGHEYIGNCPDNSDMCKHIHEVQASSTVKFQQSD